MKKAYAAVKCISVKCRINSFRHRFQPLHRYPGGAGGERRCQAPLTYNGEVRGSRQRKVREPPLQGAKSSGGV